MNTDKQKIIDLLYAFARQRSGIEPGNYSDWQSFNSERRSITKDLSDARTLIRAVELRGSITAECILKAASRAFSGRLTIVRHGSAGFKVDYCTGQYFPTEYRKAVAAVMASVLWDFFRECIPAHHGEPTYQPGIVNMGAAVRKQAQREFGRGIAGRWFN